MRQKSTILPLTMHGKLPIGRKRRQSVMRRPERLPPPLRRLSRRTWRQHLSACGRVLPARMRSISRMQFRATRPARAARPIACAGCHGEGGVSGKPGMPSLAGMEPQYLVPAMKAYASGERKHGVMRALVCGRRRRAAQRLRAFLCAAGTGQGPHAGRWRCIGRKECRRPCVWAATERQVAAFPLRFRALPVRMRNI